MSKNNIILETWRSMSELTSGKQKKFYQQKCKDGHTVECVPLEKVFTKEEIERIKRSCHIEPKMCYRNAYRLTGLFPDRVRYVEGEMTVFNGGFGIEHAWNLVDGRYYVDTTLELALKEDVTGETYVSLGEYTSDEIRKVALNTMVYGGVYCYYFIKKIKGDNKDTGI